MEIKYKNKSESNETEKNYGFISKNGKCCLSNFNFDFFLKMILKLIMQIYPKKIIVFVKIQ